MNKLTLSICIPTYNRCQYLEVILKCITRQIQEYNLQSDLEIIISDNNSTDSTVEVVHSIRSTYPDIKIVYHRNSENIGVVKNLLKTLDLASGKFWMFYGDDDLIPDGALISVCNILKKFPEIPVFIFKQKGYQAISNDEQISIQECASRYFYYMGNACTAANVFYCKENLRSYFDEITSTCWPHTHLFFLSMYDSGLKEPVFLSTIEVYEEQVKHGNNILNSFYIYDSTFYSLLRLGKIISQQKGEIKFYHWIWKGIPNLNFFRYFLFCGQVLIFQKLFASKKEKSDFTLTLRESLINISGFYKFYVCLLLILNSLPAWVIKFSFLNIKTVKKIVSNKNSQSYIAIFHQCNLELSNKIKDRFVKTNSAHSISINRGEW